MAGLKPRGPGFDPGLTDAVYRMVAILTLIVDARKITNKNSLICGGMRQAPCPIGVGTMETPCLIGEDTMNAPCPIDEGTMQAPCLIESKELVVVVVVVIGQTVGSISSRTLAYEFVSTRVRVGTTDLITII